MLKIISLGNPLRGDDGIGPFIIEQLNKQKKTGVWAEDAGADSFKVLDDLLNNDQLLIVDCAKMGKSPGSFHLFEVNSATIKRADKFISLHGFSFGEIYNMASKLGKTGKCHILAIEPKTIEFNQGLSEEVKVKVPEIINLICQEAKNYE